LADKAEVQFAHTSVIFNVITSLIVLPFAYRFGDFIVRIHGKKVEG